MNKLVIGVAVVLLGGIGWRALHRETPDPSLLFRQFWMDHEPRDDKERFSILFVNAEHPFGHFGARTVWTANLEFFHYHVIPKEPGVIDFLFGTTRERQRVRYTARACSERGFDFCLEINGSNRGVHRYYSKKEWRIDNRESEDQLVERLFAAH
jgi:hypothetical protein